MPTTVGNLMGQVMVAYLLVPALFVVAQTAQPTPVAAVPAVTVAADAYLIPAGLPVDIAVIDQVSSKTAVADAYFPIRLRTAITLGDVVVVPSGTTGVGQVVHAARARAGGKPGELVLAARYLELDGKRIPLRRFRLGGTARDRVGEAFAVETVVPFASLLISGAEKILPAGSAANALVSADTAIPMQR